MVPVTSALADGHVPALKTGDLDFDLFRDPVILSKQTRRLRFSSPISNRCAASAPFSGEKQWLYVLMPVPLIHITTHEPYSGEQAANCRGA
ncbi:hypothetical protein OMCYN_00836 [cyanobiont of Ornithocercus magnificus]|nr:hypothetical protein OMCYN_00836 [cyanobiont of Ornithocercus magnificus]